MKLLSVADMSPVVPTVASLHIAEVHLEAADEP